MTNIPIVGQAYNLSPSKQLDTQNCINWYITFDATGKSNSALLPRPGLEIWYDDNNLYYSNRGAIAINDVLYCVIDDKFFTFDKNGSKTEKGTLNTSHGIVTMLVNDYQVFVSDSLYGYVYQITKSDFHDAGEFFVITSASSNIGDPTFEGSGVDDMNSSGEYTGSTERVYRIVIDKNETSYDTFKWSDDGGTTYKATGVTITQGIQTLNHGVSIQFINKIGHTINDFWEFNVTVDSAFYVPIKPTYNDNRGIYIRKSTGRWYISDINQFERVNALDFASANYFPDNLVTSLAIKEEVWLIGKLTAEPWIDVGRQPFPYERRTSLIQNYGCAAPFSAVLLDNFIGVWLSENREGSRMVVALINYEISVISTEAINNEFNTYTKVDDALGSSYQFNGHIFYVLTFPTADRTFVYDFKTASWHEYRCTLDNELPFDNETRQGRYRANWMLQFDHNILCGDFESGIIYKLSTNVYTDNGRPIICERTTQHINDKNLLGRIEINYLELDIEKGQGLEDGQGSDPQYMLQISRDGGYTWGNEKWKSGGVSGNYRKRLRWNMLGTSRSWTFRVRTSDPVYRTIYSAIGYVNSAVE